MLTEKENYMMAVNGEIPEWIPRHRVPGPGREAPGNNRAHSIHIERETDL